jgi:hypothetical protein
MYEFYQQENLLSTTSPRAFPALVVEQLEIARSLGRPVRGEFRVKMRSRTRRPCYDNPAISSASMNAFGELAIA